ncbi:toxin-activating lysine-acyltransferase [Jannaschia rubra]|nr:toxin-activating lysine-acyltransferase [Jannaschia rubra]
MTTIQDTAAQAAADPVAGKTVAEIMGEIVWLMTQDPSARDMPIREIERIVMPAILTRAFHISYIRVEATGVLQPVSVELNRSLRAARADAEPGKDRLRFSLPRHVRDC